MKTARAVDLFIQSRQAKGLSPMTVKWYREILGLFSEKYSSLPKQPDKIEQYLKELKVGDERRHGYYRALKSFYRFLVKRRYYRHNPFDVLDQPKISAKDPQTLTPKEISIVLNYHGIHPKVRTAILVFLDTGCRLSEVADLTVDKLLELPDGFAAIVTGKTGTRTVPISYNTYHALMLNLPFQYKKAWISRHIKLVCSAVGIDATPLTFRHTFATLWQGDELILQRIMGHSSLNTTRRYRHLRMQVLIHEHNRYSPLKMVMSASKMMF